MVAFTIYSLFLVGLLSLLIILSLYLSRNSRSIEKLSPYECGLEPIGDARIKFDIIYYIIGILFLIFDLEVIFLFPIGAVFFSLSNYIAFWVGIIFLTILTIGFIYEWINGALDII